MLKRSLLASAASLALVSGSPAQTYHDASGSAAISTVPLVGCSSSGTCSGPVSSTNPLPVSGVFSASLSGYAPGSAYTAPIAVSTTSSRVALPAGTTVVVYNTGSNAAFVQLGDSSVTATTSADVVQPNSWMAFTVGSNAYLAAITASGTATLNISGGSGLPTGAGGGSAGGGGTIATGSAGSPNSSVVTMQGISGGTPAAVSLSSLPAFASIPTFNFGTLNGAALASNQTVVESSPGTSANTALTIQGSALGVAIPVTGTLSASVGGFAPGGAYASPLSVSTSSTNVTLPTGTAVAIYNTGSNAAFVKLGSSSVTAATSNDMIPAGGWLALTVGANTYLAAITASGSTSLNISGGAGLLTGSGGGGSGGGSIPTGAAGSPNASVVTVQGITGGVAQPVSLSSLPALATGSNTIGAISNTTFAATQSGTWNVNNISGTVSLPTGAATTSNQTNVQSSPGTSAATAITIQGSASGVAVPISGSIAVTTYDSGAIRVSTTPGSSAHGAGTSVGGLLSVPVARSNGGSGIITSAMVWASWGSTQTYIMRVWQKNPSNTTCTDGSAFVSSATDDANLIGPGPISVLLAAPANTTGDSKTYAYLAPLSWDYKNNDGTATQNVYVCFVSNGSDTPGSSATLSLTMSGPQN